MGKSRLPRKAQPVPPIFQPEVGAEAILFASHNARREICGGMPTVEAIFANKIAPGLLDHYLARSGYDSQQYDGATDPDCRDNLWEPVDDDEDHGAHGKFDSRVSSHSPQLWTTTHRNGSMAVGLMGAISLATGFFYLAMRGCKPARQH
jgi:hypothetical protein